MIHLSSSNSSTNFTTALLIFLIIGIQFYSNLLHKIHSPSNGKGRGSDLTRRAENAFVMYPCILSQRIKILCHIPLWTKSRGSFWNTQFRGSVGNCKVSQFLKLCPRSSTIGICSNFSEVIKPLNILIFLLIYCCKNFCAFALLFCSATSPNRVGCWRTESLALGKTQI